MLRVRTSGAREDVAPRRYFCCCLRRGMSISLLSMGGDPLGGEGVENYGRNRHLRRGGPLVLCGICS